MLWLWQAQHMVHRFVVFGVLSYGMTVWFCMVLYDMVGMYWGVGFRLNDHWQFWTSAFLQGDCVRPVKDSVWLYPTPLIFFIFLWPHSYHHHRHWKLSNTLNNHTFNLNEDVGALCHLMHKLGAFCELPRVALATFWQFRATFVTL